MKKLNKIMEAFWFIVAIATSGWVIYIFIVEGFEGKLQMLFIPTIAWAWFIFRKKMTSRYEQHMTDETPNE